MKSPEQKLVGQIDQLRLKQEGDIAFMSSLVMDAEKISQKSDLQSRRKHSEIKELIESISDCVDRRKRLLRRKGEKLSELQTSELIKQSLS